MKNFSLQKAKQKGLTLIEVLLAISVSLIVGAAALTGVRNTNEALLSNAVGDQIKTVGQAAGVYTSLYYPNIIQLLNQPAPGSAADPGPRYCTANVTTIDGLPASVCTISTNTLRSAGLLPRNFSGRNAYGSDYRIYIRVIGNSPNWIVDGVVVTSTPFSVGGVNRYDLLGKAMNRAGADAGMTRNLANTMEGLNGAWRDASFPSVVHNGATLPGVNELGLLGYRFGYGSSAYAAYVRLDGTTPMTGDLDLGNNDIIGVGTMVANYARLQGGGETLALNANTATSTDRTGFITGAGTLSIRNENGVSIQKLDGTAGNMAVGGLIATNNIEGNGNISAVGNISAQDLIANRNASIVGTLAVGGVATVGSLNSNGNIVVGGTNSVTAYNVIANNNVRGGTYDLNSQGLSTNSGNSWFYDSGADMWRTQATAGIYSGGTIRGVNVTADRTVTAGEELQILGSGGSVVTVGSACGVFGTIRRSGTGSLAQCRGGFWREMGAYNTTSITSATVGGGGNNSATATCPNGTTLVGGGHRNLAWVPAGSGIDQSSPRSSYPNGNGWTVETGQTNSVGTTFQAIALCSY